MAIKTGDSIARNNFEYERVDCTTNSNMSGSPFVKVLANHQFCILHISGSLNVTNSSDWSQVGTIPTGYRPMDDFRGCGLRNADGSIELRVESSGAISVRSPNKSDYIYGEVYYFRDLIGGTQVSAAAGGLIKPVNFSIQTSNLSFVSGMDNGVGQQKIWACNRIVIIKYDRSYPGPTTSGWRQTATIPAGFRPNGDYRSVMSRGYGIDPWPGIDVQVTSAGAFNLRNIKQNDIISGGIIYFR